MNLEERKALFLKIYKKAHKKYARSKKRLAGEAWERDWQTLIVTIMSAQMRDEVTIPIAEKLFKKYPTLESLAAAKISSIEYYLKSMNYYKTKSRHISETAKQLIERYHGKTPNTMEELLTLPGVGRKTANLVLAEIHNKDGICVDTHVHRIANVFKIVSTKTPHQTELELMKVSPKRYWSKINRLFVLWGKDVPGYDKERLLAKLEE